MRCRYCGWDNPAENSKCSKCNQPLVAISEEAQQVPNQTFNPRKTVNENTGFAGGANMGTTSESTKCTQCGYPLIAGSSDCPSCGFKKVVNGKENDEPAPKNFSRQTVRPGRRSHCSLTLIPEEKERIKPEVISYSGEEIILNRENTEPDNLTITSREQAVLIYENRKWYIQDRSDLKTTYVQAADKIELKPGDTIILGDRRFEFDY